MKPIYFILSIIFSAGLCANWHAWSEKPIKNQLYMYEYIEMDEVTEVSPKLLFVSHYNPEDPQFQVEEKGWYDVTPSDLWQWFHCSHTIVYFPWEWTAEIKSQKEKAAEAAELGERKNPPPGITNLLPQALPKAREIWPHEVLVY
jgi:hypothetical protein